MMRGKARLSESFLIKIREAEPPEVFFISQPEGQALPLIITASRVAGDRAIIARPIEKALELIK